MYLLAHTVHYYEVLIELNHILVTRQQTYNRKTDGQIVTNAVTVASGQHRLSTVRRMILVVQKHCNMAVVAFMTPYSITVFLNAGNTEIVRCI